MRFVKLTEYNGIDGDASEWILKFEFKIDLEPSPYGGKKAELIRYLLSGIAFRWHEDHINGKNYEWDEIKAKFIARFGSRAEESLDVIIATQGNLPLQEYIAEFHRKTNALGTLKPNVLTDCFIRGLCPALRLYVMTSRPENLDDAITFALSTHHQ